MDCSSSNMVMMKIDETNKVTIGYWGIRGRVQPVRTLLACCRVKEDKWYDLNNLAEWFEQDKPSLKIIFLNIPYVKNENFYISKTVALINFTVYNFKLTDLQGGSPKERARILQVYCVLTDFINAFLGILFNKDRWE